MADLDNTKFVKAFKFKIYPTKNQAKLLSDELAEACRLYNAALQERRDAYKMCGKSIGYFEQKRDIKEIRAAGDCSLSNHQVAADVIKRVDLAFQAFFRRCKAGEKPGYPRFKSAKFYDSITYTLWDNGCRFKGKKLFLSSCGNVKIRLHRELPEKIKTLTIKREDDQWFAIFTAEYQPEALPANDDAVGIDLGIKYFAAMSNGEVIDNPKPRKALQDQIRVVSRSLARRKKGSKGRLKSRKQLAKLHRKAANIRDNFQHEASRQIVNNFGWIAVENLNIKGLSSGMLAGSISDVGWGYFLHKIEYKAKEAGRVFIRVNPKGTSQTCICGNRVPKVLATRWHLCEKCGASEDRDIMAAKMILQRSEHGLGASRQPARGVYLAPEPSMHNFSDEP